jgi:hypothetical protein
MWSGCVTVVSRKPLVTRHGIPRLDCDSTPLKADAQIVYIVFSSPF